MRDPRADGRLQVIQDLVYTVAQQIRGVRDQHPDLSNRVDAALRKAHLQALDLQRALDDARGWNLSDKKDVLDEHSSLKHAAAVEALFRATPEELSAAARAEACKETK